MPEYDARVGQQRGEGLFAVELPVTPAVGRGDLPVGAQHAFQPSVVSVASCRASSAASRA